MVTYLRSLAALAPLLPLISGAAIDKRAGRVYKNSELTVHYDVEGYTQGDVCGIRANLPVGWSDVLQTDGGACGYGLFQKNARIVAVSQNIFDAKDCGTEIKLFKPDGSQYVHPDGPLIYGEKCPGCGTSDLDLSVPVLLGLDNDPCTKGRMTGYSFEITGNRVLTSGGNPDTFGYAPGAEHKTPGALAKAERLAAGQPVAPPFTRPAEAIAAAKKLGSKGGTPCKAQSDDGCHAGKSYKCDYVDNTPDGLEYVLTSDGPCLAGAKAF